MSGAYLLFHASFRAAAEAGGRLVWACKVGCSEKNAMLRALAQGGVEPAEVGLLILTDQPFLLEKMLHVALRERGQAYTQAKGREWFVTSPRDFLAVFESLSLPDGLRTTVVLPPFADLAELSKAYPPKAREAAAPPPVAAACPGEGPRDPLQCQACLHCFSDPSCLKKHINRARCKGAPVLECAVCRGVFPSSKAKYNHRARGKCVPRQAPLEDPAQAPPQAGAPVGPVAPVVPATTTNNVTGSGDIHVTINYYGKEPVDTLMASPAFIESIKELLEAQRPK